MVHTLGLSSPNNFGSRNGDKNSGENMKCCYFPRKCFKFSCWKACFIVRKLERGGRMKERKHKWDSKKNWTFLFSPRMWENILPELFNVIFFPKKYIVPSALFLDSVTSSSLELTCDLQQVTNSMWLTSPFCKPGGFNGLRSLNLPSYFPSLSWGQHYVHAKSG